MQINSRWNAVMTRDRGADGAFVYAVRSTGIFCRPSCPSRRPRRDRVVFFPTPAAAEAAGYRACRRCRPDEPMSSDSPEDRVRRACEAVARRPEARWAAADVARSAGTSVAQTQRAFRAVLGISPRDFVAAARQRRFLAELRGGGRVTDAVYTAGYGSSSRVYESFTLPGMTPATYGRGGRGARIEWLTTASSLGVVLVAATVRGLCFVAVGDTVGEVVNALADEFPAATIAREPSAHLRSFVDAAHAAAEGKPVPTGLPVDIRGTVFQWRVWRALTRLSPGAPSSYRALAESIGAPSATRAVARACATNPIALVVPCHRVVGSDGAMRGYRWGTERKRKILAAEAGANTGTQPAGSVPPGGSRPR